ncbi:MerR family transcriptional regulator [Streptomyces sp. TRM66268-LWL]|uniref:MerR family transcriptional regulator n=1 Tax=Streptomyces polyasparticus TaxID=2767826 RepID=A0ABR7SI73_9ACTN|nr:MerR family transcriptional regulator [Streptomyces polyasparticus]MBC9715216.1 MerR family transcriptional regulator [Streptomyces polyasparticus]
MDTASEARRSPARKSPGGALDIGLTTGDVARRLGIRPTTLRSWDQRYGIGPAGHDTGRHRRWAPGDIAVLEEMCRLTALGVPPAEAARAAKSTGSGELPGSAEAGREPSGSSASDGAPTASEDFRKVPASSLPLGRNARTETRGLAKAATRLDAASVQQQLAQLVSRYGPVDAWQEVIMPCLQAVGRRWESAGDRHVEIEHLLSWHVSSVLHSTPWQPEKTGAATALLACVPGEQHTLALEALSAALGARGLAVRMFGAALPAAALEDAVRRIGPAAVVLWSQVRSTANPALAQHIRNLDWGIRGARVQAKVFLAGPGWPTVGLPEFTRLHTLQGGVDAVVAACSE